MEKNNLSPRKRVQLKPMKAINVRNDNMHKYGSAHGTPANRLTTGETPDTPNSQFNSK